MSDTHQAWLPCASPLVACYGGLGQVLIDDALDLLWTCPSASSIWTPLASVDAKHRPLVTYALGYGYQHESSMARYTSTCFKYVPRIAAAQPRAESTKSSGGVLATSSSGIVQIKHTGQVEWICPSTDALQFDGLAVARMGAQVVATSDAGQALQVLDCFVGRSLRSVDVKDEMASITTHLARLDSNTLCIGSTSGQVRLIDTRQAQNSAKGTLAHSAHLTNLIVSNTTLCTTGWAMKQGRIARDPVVKVFDVRMMGTDSKVTMLKTVTWPSTSQPVSVQFNPRSNNALFVLGDNGVFGSVDLVRPEKTQWAQASLLQETDNGFDLVDDLNATRMVSMAVHPDAQVLVLGQEDGIVQFYSNIDRQMEQNRCIPFAYDDLSEALSRRRVHWADNVPPTSYIPWNEDESLAQIGMPYYDQPLLSTLPNHLYALNSLSCMRRPPPVIPTEILSKAKVAGNGVTSAPLPLHMKGHRYPMDTTSSTTTNKHSKFRSDQVKKLQTQARTQSHTNTDVSDTDSADQVPISNSTLSSNAWTQRVEIKYSRFGIGDFDFEYYNKTTQSGLESHTTNAYANALVQAIYHVQPLREIAMAHTNDNCTITKCLLCELGFLCAMLRDGNGAHCQATNFGTTLNTYTGADRLGLTDPEYNIISPLYGSLIQTLSRFLFNALAAECAPFRPSKPLAPRSDHSLDAISQVLGLTMATSVTCSCGFQVRKESVHQHVIDIQYSSKYATNDEPNFTKLLEDSIVRETTIKQECSSCKKFTPHKSRRILATSLSFPPVLTINTGISQSSHNKLWQTDNYIPDRIFIGPSGAGGLSVLNEAELDRMDTNFGEYRLRSIVLDFKDSAGSFLVTITRLGQTEKWLAFNDFLVQVVDFSMAIRSSPTKSPAILFYERTDISLDYSALNKELNTSLLHIGSSPRASLSLETLNTIPVLPKAGTHIAIDAEFVSLQQEEYALKSNGEKSVLRPSRMALARVSVVSSDGQVMIDDYIHLSEPIVDHLTEFSGIKPGDLNPKLSLHTLVPLKTAYKKIRLLLDLGCIFIGHGLTNDFRILNLFVPPSQIIDTVEIYYKADQQRKLSLKFLTWYVLKRNIQIDTHDSVEDARGGLQLWHRYLDLKEKGEWTQTLDDIFTQGRTYNFRVQ